MNSEAVVHAGLTTIDLDRELGLVSALCGAKALPEHVDRDLNCTTCPACLDEIARLEAQQRAERDAAQ